MIIGIGESGKCWVCGRDNQKMTSHHALPKHLKPVNNIIVPVCEACHKRINTEDVSGMYSHLFKIQKMVGENVGSINRAVGFLDELNRVRNSKQGCIK